MFLLRIKNVNNITKHVNIVNIEKLAYYKIQLLLKFHKISFLKKLNKKFFNNNFFVENKTVAKDFIEYILNISLSNKNTNVFITDLKGNIKTLVSIGFLDLQQKQKIKNSTIILKLLLLVFAKFSLQNSIFIGLHLTNFTKFHASFVLSLLKDHIKIKSLRIFNNKPHNGCRPRKLKRKKVKRIFFDNWKE